MADMQDAVIVSAVRTAIGIYGGGLAEVPAVKLGEICIREAMERANVKTGEVDEVIMGNVLQAGLGQNPGRQAAVLATWAICSQNRYLKHDLTSPPFLQSNVR